MYLFIVFDCLAELKKESKRFFFLSIVPYKYKLYLYFNVGRKKQQKLLDNNEWLKGIKKDVVKKTTTTTTTTKTNNQLVFRLFSYETGNKKTWDT